MAKNNSNGDTLGFEQKLWLAADKLRNNMDAAEYKHVVLGLIFLKYISDAFEEKHEQLQEQVSEGADPEEADEYRAENLFWVPEKARWAYLQKNAKLPSIGKIIDEAMELVEKENPALKGVLPNNYSRETLDKRRLGEIIDLIGTIGLGDYESRSKDVLGKVYEYFLGQFASAEGKKGGEFYTPESIVKTLVGMLEPYKGRIYDPCCGSSGMFVQSEKFIKAHQGRLDDIAIYGQESNPTTFKLSKMNLAIRGIESSGVKLGDTFHNDLNKDLKADFIIANPPFNISDWGGEHLRDDVRWKYGVPPTGNANYAWVQHMIHHLAPHGVAGFVLSNGSMSSNISNEGVIRENIVKADLVDCMVAMPSQLFFNTMIPACLWFIARDKKNHKFRNRSGEVLFINAHKMGFMKNRRNRALSDNDVKKISDTYHAWRGEPIDGKKVKYEDVLGFCKSAKLDEIEKHGFILTPGRYVGVEEEEDDGIPFEDKMKELTSELSKQMEEGKKLDEEIKKNLEGIGFKV